MQNTAMLGSKIEKIRSCACSIQETHDRLASKKSALLPIVAFDSCLQDTRLLLSCLRETLRLIMQEVRFSEEVTAGERGRYISRIRDLVATIKPQPLRETALALLAQLQQHSSLLWLASLGAVFGLAVDPGPPCLKLPNTSCCRRRPRPAPASRFSLDHARTTDSAGSQLNIVLKNKGCFKNEAHTNSESTGTQLYA